jgi:ribosomal subunit interface protein
MKVTTGTTHHNDTDWKGVEMNIEVRGTAMAITVALREHATRRLLFALSRFAPRLRRIEVRLDDINGPRGGVDKRCRVAIGVRAGAALVVEQVDSDMYAAIARAADRAGRAVDRSLARGRAAAAAGNAYRAA